MNKLNSTTIIESILNTFGVAPSNENSDIPSQRSLNLMNTVTSVFCFFIAAAFSSFLIAELLTVSFKFPFTGLNDIWLQNEYGLCVFPGDYAHIFLEREHPVFNNEKCFKLLNELHYENFENLCNSPYAVFITTLTKLYNDKNRLFSGIIFILLSIKFILLIILELSDHVNLNDLLENISNITIQH